MRPEAQAARRPYGDSSCPRCGARHGFGWSFQQALCSMCGYDDLKDYRPRPEAERSERQAGQNTGDVKPANVGADGPVRGDREEAKASPQPAPLRPETASQHLRRALTIAEHAVLLGYLHQEDWVACRDRIVKALDLTEATIRLAAAGNQRGAIQAVMERL